jgi:hypothetical protein
MPAAVDNLSQVRLDYQPPNIDVAAYAPAAPVHPGEQLTAELRSELPAVTDQAITDQYELSKDLRLAIAKGWKATYSLLFDDLTKFERPFVPNLATHHVRAIKWHWISRHRVLRGQKPTYYAYFPILSRGHMKSTLAKRIAIVDAILSMYYEKGGYCLYFSGTDSKTRKHAISISRLIEKVAEHAPALARVKKAKEGGRSLGWKAEFFYTEAGYIFHFGSLQSGLAGGNVDDIRPTLMIPDDIDDRKDSAVVSEGNFNLLTTEILPMGATGTLTFWAQNLISRYAAMYRIYKGHARVLTNRMKAKPIPAILDPQWDVQTIGGTVRDVLVGGTPTWKFFGMEECQEEINRIGKESFIKECQHDVELSREGLMIQNYDDKVHPISESEFSSVYGSLRAWKPWAKWIGHDWARTKTEFHANVAAYISVSSQDAPLPGHVFIFHPMSFAANTEPEDVAERILSQLEPYAYQGQHGIEGKTWAEVRQDEVRRANAHLHTQTVKDKLAYERGAIAKVIPQYAKEVLASWNVKGGTFSHSEDTIRKLYRTCYGINLTPANPTRFDKVDDINRDFKVDYKIQHPFRPQLGYTRMHIVVPDWKNCPADQIRTDEKTGAKIYPPKPFPDQIRPDDLHDDDLIRYQLATWRARAPKLTEAGEIPEDVLKLNDDFGQLLQMHYLKKALTNEALPTEDFAEEHLPIPLKQETITAQLEAGDTRAADAAAQRRRMEKERIMSKLTAKTVSPGINRIRRR